LNGLLDKNHKRISELEQELSEWQAAYHRLSKILGVKDTSHQIPKETLWGLTELETIWKVAFLNAMLDE